MHTDRPTETGVSPVEKAVEIEIQAIKHKIADLQNELKQLERILVRLKSNKDGIRSVVRRNSIDRVIIESKIIELIGVGKTSKKLFEELKIFFPDLNDNTFRSHLHRMKIKGVIYKKKSHGKWELGT